MKCTKCAHVWHFTPHVEFENLSSAGDIQSVPPLDNVVTDAVPTPPEPKPRARIDELPAEPDFKKFEEKLKKSGDSFTEGKSRPGLLSTAVAASIALLFVLMPQTVMGIWPASVVVYHTLGFGAPVPGEGITIDGVTISVLEREGLTFMKVDGMIFNKNQEITDIPPMVVEVRGGSPLDPKIFEADKKRLLPGETSGFSVLYTLPKDTENPPKTAIVSFINR